MVRGTLTAGMVVAIALCAGCAGQASEENVPGGPFAEALAEAREGGAGPDQLADLEAAAQAQGVSIEMAREAARRAVACMTDAGLSAAYVESTTNSGLVIPSYRVEVSATSTVESDGDAQISACDVREAFWINQLQQTQPTSVQMNEEYANQQEPVLRACLARNGIATEPDATGADLAQESLEVIRESDGDINCLAEAGITSW